MFSIYYIAFSVWQPFVTNKLSVELELIRLYFEIICGSFQVNLFLIIYNYYFNLIENKKGYGNIIDILFL